MSFLPNPVAPGPEKPIGEERHWENESMAVSIGAFLVVVVFILVVLLVIWLIWRGLKRMENEPIAVSPEGTEWKDIGTTLGHHKP